MNKVQTHTALRKCTIRQFHERPQTRSNTTRKAGNMVKAPRGGHFRVPPISSVPGVSLPAPGMYKVFEIGDVPDKEVNDVRFLLQKNKVKYYETPQGNFGSSMAAIWVYDDETYSKAKSIIDEYEKNLNSPNRSKNRKERDADKTRHRNTLGIYALVIFIFVIVIWRLVYEISLF